MYYFLAQQVELNSVWLKDSFSSKAFFPDQNITTFAFPPEVGLTIISLKVEGLDASPTLPAASNTTIESAGIPGPSGLGRFGRNVLVPQSSKKEGRWQFESYPSRLVL